MSLRAIAQAEHEPHRAMRVGEARDLVVDEPRREAAFDQLSVLDGSAASLRPHDPDGTVGLDPALGFFDLDQVALLVRGQEHDVAAPARPAAHDGGSPLAQERQKSRVVEADDRHAQPRFDAELVEQRTVVNGLGAHRFCSASSVPRTAPNTITPSSHPAYAPATPRTMRGSGLATRLDRSRPRATNTARTSAPAAPPATAPMSAGPMLGFFRPRSPAGL